MSRLVFPLFPRWFPVRRYRLLNLDLLLGCYPHHPFRLFHQLLLLYQGPVRQFRHLVVNLLV